VLLVEGEVIVMALQLHQSRSAAVGEQAGGRGRGVVQTLRVALGVEESMKKKRVNEGDNQE
jgi:hypothetical protein